jgi:hypothetical protein
LYFLGSMGDNLSGYLANSSKEIAWERFVFKQGAMIYGAWARIPARVEADDMIKIRIREICAIQIDIV